MLTPLLPGRSPLDLEDCPRHRPVPAVQAVARGKTSLTERLLYAAGVIGEIGSVEDGSTQTDTLALERQRGITIKSAVVSFTVGDLAVNLIDTPGHPDFIAEVERVLSVLDGAVLVISAVEGVQAQTRVLMRTLRRLRIPTLIFVNKIDRRGAQDDRVLSDIGTLLAPAVIAMGPVRRLGSHEAVAEPYGLDDEAFAARLAELLADHGDEFLAACVSDELAVSPGRLREEFVAQVRRARSSAGNNRFNAPVLPAACHADRVGAAFLTS